MGASVALDSSPERRPRSACSRGRDRAAAAAWRGTRSRRRNRPGNAQANGPRGAYGRWKVALRWAAPTEQGRHRFWSPESLRLHGQRGREDRRSFPPQHATAESLNHDRPDPEDHAPERRAPRRWGPGWWASAAMTCRSSTKGVLAEHRWTREHAGLFDVSPTWASARSPAPTRPPSSNASCPATMKSLKAGQAEIFGVAERPDGGIIDDLMAGQVPTTTACSSSSTPATRTRTSPSGTRNLEGDAKLTVLDDRSPDRHSGTGSRRGHGRPRTRAGRDGLHGLTARLMLFGVDCLCVALGLHRRGRL